FYVEVRAVASVAMGKVDSGSVRNIREANPACRWRRYGTSLGRLGQNNPRNGEIYHTCGGRNETPLHRVCPRCMSSASVSLRASSSVLPFFRKTADRPW